MSYVGFFNDVYYHIVIFVESFYLTLELSFMSDFLFKVKMKICSKKVKMKTKNRGTRNKNSEIIRTHCDTGSKII